MKSKSGDAFDDEAVESGEFCRVCLFLILRCAKKASFVDTTRNGLLLLERIGLRELAQLYGRPHVAAHHARAFAAYLVDGRPPRSSRRIMRNALASAPLRLTS